MKTIEVTIQEIWQATRPIVHKNKKAYNRKEKHKNRKITYYESNQLLGNFEGWKRPCLLFKMIFCIGTDDKLLPTSKKWMSNILVSNSETKGHFKEVPVFETSSLNMHSIALTTLVSLWELFMFSQAKDLSVTDIHTYHKVIRNNHPIHL